MKNIRIEIYRHWHINEHGVVMSYIGQTTDSRKRWKGNGKHYGKTSRFAQAISKYSWSSFHHDILIVVNDEIDGNYYEEYYIKKYHSDDPYHGYNTNHGGNQWRDCFYYTEEAANVKLLDSICKKRGYRYWDVM